MEEEDRISSLPECLIVEILCRLESTKEAIRTSTLSKRWIHLWTLVPNLIFDITMYPKSDDLHSYVDQIITECGGKLKNLKKFEISVSYSPLFESSVNNWIQYVINRNVQEFHLLIPFDLYSSCEDDFVLPQSIFNNACFTILTLAGCVFSPTGSIAWKNLTTLSVCFVELDEDLIQYILSGSPVLETFKLAYCYGFTRLDITSKSVKNLVYSEDKLIMPRNAPSVIEINAPYTLSLTLNAPYTLSLMLNVSSLIKAELNFWKTGKRVKSWQEMPEDFIQNLRHVKELKIGGNVFTVIDVRRSTSSTRELPDIQQVPGKVSVLEYRSIRTVLFSILWQALDCLKAKGFKLPSKINK